MLDMFNKRDEIFDVVLCKILMAGGAEMIYIPVMAGGYKLIFI